jgi:4-hydroxymandelate synthase
MLSTPGALNGLTVDHVEFYVTDASACAAEFVARYGFDIAARSDDADPIRRSVAVRQGRIVLVFTEGIADEHPASGYVQSHGDGVANIALRTGDARAALAKAVDGGARAIQDPVEVTGCVTASVAAFGDVVHTFVERRNTSVPDHCPPGLAPVGSATGELDKLDHFAVCLPAGELATTVAFYESALGFTKIFEERIVVGAQAMNSQVVQSASREVTLTLIEPDTSLEPGQIDHFVKEHGGAGVQHLAFATPDIVRSVARLRDRGVEFLNAPDAYYGLLTQRLNVSAHGVEELRDFDILVDSDHDGQLFQIFTRSTHPRRTFFMELIERRGAQTFGSGNIKALYEAVELERTR